MVLYFFNSLHTIYKISSGSHMFIPSAQLNAYHSVTACQGGQGANATRPMLVKTTCENSMESHALFLTTPLKIKTENYPILCR
jgi:hypothetical protein